MNDAADQATRWNRARYTLWAKFYDGVVRLGKQRKRAIQLLDLRAGDRVLIVGAGTGADLPFLPHFKFEWVGVG